MQSARLADDDIDILAVLENLWRERLIIVACVVVSAVVGAGYLWMQIPQHMAAVDIQPQQIGVLTLTIPEDQVPTAAGLFSQFSSTVVLQETFSQYFRAHPEQLGCPAEGGDICIQAAHARFRFSPASSTSPASKAEMTYASGIDGKKVLASYVDATAKGVHRDAIRDVIDKLSAELERRSVEFAEKRELRDLNVEANLANLRDDLARARELGIKRATIGTVTQQTGQLTLEQSMPTYLFGTDIIEQRIKAQLDLKHNDLRIVGAPDLKMRISSLQRIIQYLKKVEPVPAVRATGLRGSFGPISPRYGQTMLLMIVLGAVIGAIIAAIRSGLRHRHEPPHPITSSLGERLPTTVSG